MGKLLIIEGPDGSGKTTLTEKIMHQSNAKYGWENHGPYRGEKKIMHHYLNSLQTARTALHKDETLILDRAWPSEPVYGNAFRGGLDRLGHVRRRMLDRVALSLQGIIILAMPSFDRCRDAWASRRDQEMLTAEQQLRNVYDGYKMLLDCTNDLSELPVVEYDYAKGHRIEDILSEVERQRPMSNHGPGIGHFMLGNTLIVGNEPRHQRHPLTEDLVFVSDYSGSCSTWLTEQLIAWDVKETHLYWVNTHDCDGARTSDDFLKDLRPQRIIALGKRAQRWCLDAGVASFEVSHPQHWKRFHAHEEYKELKLALGVR